MKFWLGILVGLILGISGTIAGYFFLGDTKLGYDDGLTVTFTEAEIQGRLGEKFPKSERLLDLIPVEIAEPRVRFLRGSNRVELTMEADVAVPWVQTYRTTGVFTTSIRYEPEDQTLRLSDIKVEDFDATNLPEKFKAPLRITLTAAADKYLNDHPVHQLEPKDYKGKMVKMLLREITVKEGELEVKLGL
jgi:hypothetical protein